MLSAEPPFGPVTSLAIYEPVHENSNNVAF